MTMSTSATLDRIRNHFYEGIAMPGDWYAGLDALRTTLGAEVFHFLTVDTRQSTVLDSVDNQGSVGLYAQLMRDYEQHSVRSDLKNLMRKTGAHRQADVIGLLQSLRLG